MHSVLAHRWACLVVLTGLSTTLATPLPDDLLAFALSDNPSSDIFNSDIPSFDSAPQDISYLDDFSQEPSQDPFAGGNILFEDDPLLGLNPSLGDNSFDLAYKVGSCHRGEIVQAVGTVNSPGCASPTPFAGCGQPGSAVVSPFNSQLPVLCAEGRQYCCASALGPQSLGGCDIAVPGGITFGQVWDGVTGFFQDPIDAALGVGAAAVVGAGAIGGALLRLNPRDDGFCEADYS